MKLLVSKKVTLPTVYFITDREEVKEIPPGIPYIYGLPKEEKYIIRLLEYEVIYDAAMRSGYPFNFKQLLREAGFEDMTYYKWSPNAYIEHNTVGEINPDVKTERKLDDGISAITGDTKFKEFIKSSSVYVDRSKLKSLNVFPVWLNKIEEAIETNIHNFAVYNPNMYNKKLEGMYGSLDLTSPDKNLIIIDISGSIPRAVSSTCLAMAKNLAESFYADLLITGSMSTLYPYEQIQELDVETIYETNGMNNDQSFFKELVSTVERTYRTAIVFGDNDEPGYPWKNSGRFKHSVPTSTISNIDGQKLCKWKIDKLISFHTHDAGHLAGYARWFKPKEVEKIRNWVRHVI